MFKIGDNVVLKYFSKPTLDTIKYIKNKKSIFYNLYNLGIIENIDHDINTGLSKYYINFNNLFLNDWYYASEILIKEDPNEIIKNIL